MATEPINVPQAQSDAEAIQPTSPVFRSPEPERVPIASSESFGLEDVRAFLAKTPATIVTLLGDRDSGKSTLICSIYDRFLHGPFAGQNSSGTFTITGLEQRAHLERIESGRTTPDTQHTSFAEGLSYFHFGISSETHPEKKTALLISDRAGETYKNARGNPGLVSTLSELPLADYLAVLVDGKRLADLTTRAGAFFAVRQTLQLLADHQPQGANHQVQIIITKIDLINAAPDADDLRSSLEEFKARLLSSFGSRFQSLNFFEIAARAMVGAYQAAHGVNELIHSWLAGPRKRAEVAVAAIPPETEFDLLAQRPSDEELTS